MEQTSVLEMKSLAALKWIADLLNKNKVPFCVGGGMATFLYGSGRTINDIDISISGIHFPALVALLKEYIVAGPKHYKNEKWDCTTLSLNYHGQDIDLTDVDTLLMSKRDGTGWIKNKEIYQKHPCIIKKVEGISIAIMDPRVLLEYKQELEGEYQDDDRAFLEQYIKSLSGI